MATITEDYCSREIYRLLLKKGFDGEIHTSYDEEGYTQPSITLQIAIKWLREVHNIDIVIDAAVGMLGVKVYVPFISTYKPLKDEPSKVRQIKRGIYYKDDADKGVIPALQHFDSYEEACEAALKYSLEILI